MRCLRLTATILFLYCVPAAAIAQTDMPWAGFALDGNFIAGKVLKHSVKFTLPLPKVITAYDLDFSLQTYGKKTWEQRRRFPLIGIGLTYTDYHNDSVYGRCIGLYPNIQLSLVRGKHLEWTVRIGDGIGYVSKRYQRIAPVDTLNTAIGSRINDYFLLMTDLRYHVNKHLDIQVGGNFQHISDASFHQPNLGINTYGAHIGIRYFPVTSKPKPIIQDLPRLKNRWLVEGRLSMAGDQVSAPSGPEYPVYMATIYASRRWLGKNKYFGGIDYSYHEATYAFLRNNEIEVGKEAQHSYKSALFIGNEFLMGRLGIVFQAGFYLKDTYGSDDVYYEKIGGNLYLINKEKGPLKELFISALLKTHNIVAELGEFGIGAGF